MGIAAVNACFRSLLESCAEARFGACAGGCVRGCAGRGGEGAAEGCSERCAEARVEQCVEGGDDGYVADQIRRQNGPQEREGLAPGQSPNSGGTPGLLRGDCFWVSLHLGMQPSFAGKSPGKPTGFWAYAWPGQTNVWVSFSSAELNVG